MTVKRIMLYSKNEAVLRYKCQPVGRVTRNTRQLVDDLTDTLLDSKNGIGLAAPQINAHSRVVVVRLGGRSAEGGEAGPPMALINPVIHESGDEQKDFDGCLSFPGLYGSTVRPHRLRVTWLDACEKQRERLFEGFDAVVVHHEIDHLNGVLFIDRIQDAGDLYWVRAGPNGQIERVPMTELAKYRG